MSIAQVLAGCREFTDLPRLAAALGAEPLWQELAPAPWLGVTRDGGRTGVRLGERIRRAALVGRSGELPWFGLEGEDPAALAARVAARLAAGGRPAALLARDPLGHRLAVAVAWGARPVLAVEPAAPGRIALACLARVADARAAGLSARAAAIADALAGEGVGRRFFLEFRGALERMTDGLGEAQAAARGAAARHAGARLDAAERRELALLQLSRVLFLYFVQSKGWLAGDEAFLARQVERGLARGRRLHRDLFRPLFFGTLNRRAVERGRGARAFGAIPFLNGGLFEPHPLERRWRGDVPNHLWRDAFDRLFERFHFTVDERAPGTGIAPDMLGRVFEGLMAPEARRGSGTFYTPAALVARLLDEGLAVHAAYRLGTSTDEADRRLRAGEPAALDTLTRLTLLDPAVGSGAFLLGALERLATLRARRTVPDTRTGEPRPTAALKRAVLRHSLFGVDRDATAVRLTELRLWLSVVADDETTAAALVRPLPNLDTLVRQGDSLVDGLAGLPDLPPLGAERGAALGVLRRRVTDATGDFKRALVRELRRAEAGALRELLDEAERRTDAVVAACLAEARAPTLLEARRGLDAALRARLAEARARRRRLRRARRHLGRTGEVPWFAYEVQFADVMSRGGFDLVVGNPPWVRAEALPAATRAHLAERYRWWRGAGPGFAHRPDLAVAFLERATTLAAPGGVVAMLVPAKLATAGYGARARHALATRTTLHTVADLTDAPAARFEATVYPLALVAATRPPASGHAVRTTLRATPASPDTTEARYDGRDAGRPATRVAQAALAAGGGAPWVLVPDPLREALAALAHHPRLGDRVRCQLGVKTGANDLFLDPPDDVEDAVLRWAVRGRDVAPFRCRQRTRLLWPCDAAGRPLAALPPRAAAHLAPARPRLLARSDYDGGPPWTLFRTTPACAPHRVVWADLARRLQAAALTGEAAARLVPLNTCYVAPVRSAGEAHALAAWLNSRWLRLVARLGAVPAASGHHRFSARTVEALPLPAAVPGDADLAALARAAARGRPVQDDLDALAFRHLGLPLRARRTLADLARAESGGDRLRAPVADDRR
ncbi:MAG TPA: hypothetical protein VFS40_13930 [Gemmatimonadales bacterium]|nr:hypothetical protein [Gemmatimonadales bacterium]